MTEQEQTCECGHPFYAHHGQGPCIAALTKTPKAKGSVVWGSVCPCVEYRPKP